MPKKKDNGGLSNSTVTRGFCDERFQRSLDQINNLKESIDEAKKTTVEKSEELKTEIQKLVSEKKDEQKEQSHAWRNLLGTIIGGAVVALIGFLVSRL